MLKTSEFFLWLYPGYGGSRIRKFVHSVGLWTGKFENIAHITLTDNSVDSMIPKSNLLILTLSIMVVVSVRGKSTNINRFLYMKGRALICCDSCLSSDKLISTCLLTGNFLYNRSTTIDCNRTKPVYVKLVSTVKMSDKKGVHWVSVDRVSLI